MQIRDMRQRRLGTLDRVLLLTTVLIIWAVSPSEAQERSPGPAPAVGAQLSERSRKALEEAERLAKANDLKGAIKLLEPLAEGGDAEVPVLIKLGELYLASSDIVTAEKWLERAIERADKTGEPLVGNPFVLGATLFGLRRYQEAIPLLESEWRIGRRIDSRVVALLAKSYEATGAMSSAYQAYETMLASDPGNAEAWSALARIKAKAAASMEPPPGPGVPAPPPVKEFSEVISLGDPRNWSREEREKGLAVYRRYAEALERSGVFLVLRAVWREMAIAAVMPCMERTDDGSMRCVEAIAQLSTIRPINSFDTNIQRMIYLGLVAAHTRMEQYVHALSALERFIALPPVDNTDEVGRVRRLLKDVFMSVSWNQKSSQPRENDPDDFVELLVSDPPGQVLLPGGTTGRTPRKMTGKAPYGMASPDEDYATISDWVGTFDEDFYELILLRIRQKNFELPVKVLLLQLAQLNSYGCTGVNDRYLKALDSAINEAGEGVSPTTLEGYAVAKRMFELMKPEKYHPRHSRAAHPEN